MNTAWNKQVLLGVLSLLVAGTAVASAFGAMRSQRIDRDLCETTGGARIVDVPGFPGERIDRRLLDDIRLLERRYKIFITDGYSNDPVHSSNGEHPMGLALDIVPNTAAGGTWRDISALARWAEPSQDRPRSPFRWVGYNGDTGHGRGHHLHLSWNHSETRPGNSPATVYTLRCPSGKVPPRGSSGGSGAGGDGDGGGGTGGVKPGGGGGSSGGVGARVNGSGYEAVDPADPVVESRGVDEPVR